MIRISCAAISLSLLSACTLFAQVEASLSDDGFIVLSGNDVELIGVDLLSKASLLIPVPGDSGVPFGFLLSNKPEQITYGTLNSFVTLNGELVLSAGYGGDSGDSFGNDLAGSEWGTLTQSGPLSFPVTPVIPDPVDPDPVDPDPVDPGPVVPDPDVPDGGGGPTIPEPSSSVLMVLALFGFSLNRPRRS